MYACIDLGSNSFHLLIGEWVDERIKILERCSEKVQLGEDVPPSGGSISPQAFERGVVCLQQFKALMDNYPLEQYWALGTNTFRIADNAAELIHVSRGLGIDISIISGVQEAVLIYAGVISSLPVNSERRLVIDIGGGSTEIIIGQSHERYFTESLAIGSVAWRDQFFSDQYKSTTTRLAGQIEKGLNAAKQIFAVAAPAIATAGWTDAYACSGTTKMLATICEEHGFGKAQIKLRALHALKQEILFCIANRTQLPGMNESRRDLLLAGWCAMVGLMETFEVEIIKFSATALREGMLDFMAKNKKTMGAMEWSNLPDVSQAGN